MNQRKYLVYAVLLLLAVAGVYFAVQKLSKNRVVENSPTLIDYDKPVDNLTKTRSDGKILYMSKCISCHGSFMKNDGPRQTLAGFENRWPDKKELFAFIRNPEEVMKRNAYAGELKNISASVMTGAPDLTDEEIQSILDYIKREINPEK